MKIHRLKFIEWVDRLGLENIFPEVDGFMEERLRLRRFSLIFLFSMLFELCFNLGSKTPTDFRIGEVAKVDIVSPSFEMVDEVTTEEKSTCRTRCSYHFWLWPIDLWKKSAVDLSILPFDEKLSKKYFVAEDMVSSGRSRERIFFA